MIEFVATIRKISEFWDECFSQICQTLVDLNNNFKPKQAWPKLVTWRKKTNCQEKFFKEIHLRILRFLFLLLQTQSSHLRDELLMLLGFLSFKGFPVKTSGVHLCWCLIIYCTCLIVIYCTVYKIKRIYANAKIQQ